MIKKNKYEMQKIILLLIIQYNYLQQKLLIDYLKLLKNSLIIKIVLIN